MSRLEAGNGFMLHVYPLHFLDTVAAGPAVSQEFANTRFRLFVQLNFEADKPILRARSSLKEDLPPEWLKQVEPWLLESRELVWNPAGFLEWKPVH
jgi:hypothetical protein